MLTVGSLFSGIGGLDLGLERAGMRVRWQVENNPYCIRVLEKHWSAVKRYGDIKQIKWSEVEPVDLICGGFPCQPVSAAGARKGDKDERWLWPEFLRAIREVRPRYALVENVPGLLSTDDGRLARGVFGDLAEIGYDAEWDIVSAADVGAPHLRKRIFIVAYPLDTRSGKEPLIFTERFYSSLTGYDGTADAMGNAIKCGCNRLAWGRSGQESENGHSKLETGAMANADRQGFSRSSISVFRGGPRQENADASGAGKGNVPDTDRAGLPDIQGGSANEERHRDRTSNSSGWWDVEPDVGRVADGVPSRVDRLKCLGNAVVPQVAEFIGKAIIEAEGVTQ
jgi:DNA (cytosine-5)-methyltransferase 1